MGKNKLQQALLDIVMAKTGGDWAKYQIPAPVFTAMRGELVSYDIDKLMVCCRFPVLSEQLNSYGKMQGGIISAAIDNVVGTLSMLVGPPSVTRTAEVKYINEIDANLDFVYVTATFSGQKKNFLYFDAKVGNQDGSVVYSKSKFTNWIFA